MGIHRTNRKVKTGNRKDQQRRLKASWRITLPGSIWSQEYLPVEDNYRMIQINRRS